MSIYATLWKLKFPKEGDEHLGCEWIEVSAQAVPPHIGSPTLGCGYEHGDPYAAFLPPALQTDAEGDAPSIGRSFSSPNTRPRERRAVRRNIPASS